MITIFTSKIRIFVQAATFGMALGFLSPAFAAIVGTRAYLIDLNSKEISDLGTLGGTNAYLSAINDAGQVVGGSEAPPDFRNHAFVTGPNGTGITDLGAGWAYGINDIGQVAGASNTTGHAFITGPNGIGVTDLGTLGGRGSNAIGINSTGQVAGISETAVEGQARGFITGPNGVGMTELGTLGGKVDYVGGINDAGQVVGASEIAGSQFRFHAFITGPNGIGITDLGTLGGISSGAGAINSVGQVVGSFTTLSGEDHAFITGPDGTGTTDLGTLGGTFSNAYGINDAGQVVGVSSTSSGEEHAFVTGPNGVGMTDLNLLIPHPESVFLWTQAKGINNHGQVIVEASIVPEPETYAMLLAGLALIGFMARRRTLRENFPSPAFGPGQ